MPTLYRLKVHAEERREEIQVRSKDSFEIWTRAPRTLGRANAAALLLLARALGVEAKRLKIVKGGRSPSKIVALL